MKKLICVLISLITLVSLFAACGKKEDGASPKNKEVTYKDDQVKVYEGFNYVIDEEGNAAVVKYTGHDFKEKLTIPDQLGGANVTVIAKGAFENSDRLQEVRFPTYLEEIQDGAFKGSTVYSALMVYSRHLKTIGSEAFSDCKKLVQLDIPETVENFGKNCFTGCEHLKVVTFRGNNININKSDFEGSDGFTLWTYEKNTAVTDFGKANGIEVKYLPS